MTGHSHPRRRTLLLATTSAAFLAACGGGGGGGEPGTPSIQEFSAEQSAYFVGDVARLRVRYSGGTGRIEPYIGPVAASATVGTGPLERSTTFRLVVEGPGRSAASDLVLPVSYRNRHREIGQLQIAEHSAVGLDDGTVLVIGGSRAELNILSPWIERVDPRTGAVTRAAELATGRANGVATRLADGRTMLTGGVQTESIPGRMNEIVAVDADGAVRVSGTGDLARRRLGHTATLLADGRVLVTGGTTTGEGAPGGISRSAELWDPASGRFRLLARQMATGRTNHSATRLPDGKVLIVGGYTAAGTGRLAEVFDPVEETFTPVDAPGLPSRALHAAVALPGGDVLILGGENIAGTQTLSSVLRYRHATHTLQPQPDLLTPRRGAEAVATPDGAILVFGGIGADDDALASGERYSPSEGSRPLATMAAGRFGHTAVLLRGPSAGRVLQIGGWARGWYNPMLAVYE
jgi:hypothetical protein